MTTDAPDRVTGARTRMVWMDALRGIAIVLIVALHATAIAQSSGLPISRAILIFNGFMEPFRIPLLMTLSGMLLGGSLRKGTGRYLQGKVRAILWPYIVWTLVAFLYFPFLGVEMLQRAVWAPSTYLWYLHTLFLCYLIALALRRVPPLTALAIVLAIGLVVQLLPLAEPFSLMSLGRTCAMLVCFLTGHLFMEHLDEALAVLRRWWVTALLLVLGVGLGWLGLQGTVQVANNPWFSVPIIATIGAGIGIAQRIPWTSLPGRWIRWVGRHSIIYYVMHWIVIDFSLRFIRLLPDWRGFVVVPALVLTALAVCGLVALAQRSLPPVRWLFRI